MRTNVLLSCMKQSDNSIVSKSNLKHDVVIVNQCNINEEVTNYFPQNIIRIDTPTKGLSVSRNIAIKNANSEICIIADDDEIFKDNYEDIIKSTYQKYSDADIIVFLVENHPCKIKKRIHKLSYFELFRVSSVQITFKLKSIIKTQLQFDQKLGSGTGNGGGEEIKFLIEANKRKLNIYYVPKTIASLNQDKSQWFFGYDEKYFYDRGRTTRYTFGFVISLAYAFYYTFTHRKQFKQDISTLKALKNTIKGIIDNNL